MKIIEENFERNWADRKESNYNHWTLGWPRNQIQLAFRRHWITFQSYLRDLPVHSVLEVGCGRGSISSYFADAGFNVTLLDTSATILDVASKVFEANGHKAECVHGDAFRMPFEDDRFGVCVSIGLMEHFDDIEGLLREQIRVLAPGGVLLAYVVPERPDNVQRYFRWLNRIFKALDWRRAGASKTPAKTYVYRNELTADAYEKVLLGLCAKEVASHGMYPMPMLSHSPDFPFTLLWWPLERSLVAVFSTALCVRRILFRRDPWRCRETFGQAFLVTARKPRGAERHE